MADTIKCPRCSANVVFDVSKQKITCAFCGTEFAPEELMKEINEEKLFEHAKAEEPTANKLEWEKQQFACNSCGATVFADVNTSTTFCMFCGSPAIIAERFTGEFEPDYIIPFKIDKDTATTKFLKWCKGGLMTPFNFVSPKNIAKMKGLYVPFWLFDVDAKLDMVGTGKKVLVTNSGNETTTITDVYNVTRKMNACWNNMPFDGIDRIDDDLMAAVQPYNYDDLVKFSPMYLPGFFSEKYDVSAEDLTDRVVYRSKEYAKKIFKEYTTEYNSSTISQDNSEYNVYDHDYALFPVWFLRYKYLGKTYEFVMNGQTGEVAGIPPQSIVKKIMASAVVLAIAAVIVKIIVSLMLGGFVG